MYCPNCEKVFPVFNNVHREIPQGGSRRRNLLQDASTQVTGSYTILLVYDKSLLEKPIYYADISKAVYNSTYTPVWAGSTDESTIQNFMDSLSNQQFVVRRIQAYNSTQ